MKDQPNSKDVFVQAVKDHLDGTPHAHHPVQFEEFTSLVMVRCTLCHATVPEHYQDDHRRWHDSHVRVHDQILAQAERHTPAPRFG